MDQSLLVPMKQKYPFGQLKQPPTNGEVPLVCKKINLTSAEEIAILEKMVQLMKKLKHEFLISIQKTETPSDKQFVIFYQYVPLTLEKWVLDLGDEFLEDLQFQVLSLANFLTQQNIKFSFDPNCLGLNEQMKIKYFLHEFSVDPQNKMNNYKVLEGDISGYFRQFKQFYANSSENSTQPAGRKSADSAMVPPTLEIKKDRGSWQVGMTNISDKNRKEQLSKKIQNSKRKSIQVLMKLKGLKPKSQV